LNLSQSVHKDKLFVVLEIEGQNFKFQIDTGANCNVISLKDLQSLSKV